MVIAEIKRLEEIKEMLKDYKKVLNVGCAGCTAVCLAGGQKEVDNLNTKLSLSFKGDNIPFEIEGFTVERQCEVQFLAELDGMVKSYDALLSMACGAGIQFLAERYPETPVFPAVNSTFVGVNKDIGWYEERCKCCGDCVLGSSDDRCAESATGADEFIPTGISVDMRADVGLSSAQHQRRPGIEEWGTDELGGYAGTVK